MAVKVSEHFTWEELTHTSHRDLDNTPGPEESANLSLLANEQLEGMRAVLDCPLHINSGYRSPAVNAAVGGAKTSQHMQGCAADVVPLGALTLKQALEKILASGLAFDQLIYEYGRWIHISRPTHGGKYRRQVLMIFEAGKYLPWDPEGVR